MRNCVKIISEIKIKYSEVVEEWSEIEMAKLEWKFTVISGYLNSICTDPLPFKQKELISTITQTKLFSTYSLLQNEEDH